jgi:hypothetical protein
MSTSRSATAILAEIREGRLVLELSEEIKKAIAAVNEHGKAAIVTLDLTIEPLRKGSENLVEAPLVFTGEVSSKLPKPKPESTLFFVGADGNVSRQPGERQPALGLSVAASSSNKT